MLGLQPVISSNSTGSSVTNCQSSPVNFKLARGTVNGENRPLITDELTVEYGKGVVGVQDLRGIDSPSF